MVLQNGFAVGGGDNTIISGGYNGGYTVVVLNKQTNPTFSVLPTAFLFPYVEQRTSGGTQINFGQIHYSQLHHQIVVVIMTFLNILFQCGRSKEAKTMNIHNN